MNNIIKVNIAGLAFSLSMDAHARLSTYLEFLNRHYDSHEQKSEILEGIEERIAELLMDKCEKEVAIPIEIIEDVISILGNPETIEKEEPESPQQTRYNSNKKRKLYRDPNHKVIGGVLSGIAHYLGVRPVFIRLAFLVLFFMLDDMTGFLPHIDNTLFSLLSLLVLYLGLCIFIPIARTVEEQWDMMGEASNVNGIQNSANPHISNKQPFNPKRSESLLGRLIMAFVKIIGVCIMAIGASVLTSIIICFFFLHLTQGLSWVDGLSLLNIEHPDTIFILLFTVMILPAMAALYLGTKLTFGFRSPKWHPLLIGGLLFIITLTALGLLATPSLKHYTKHKTYYVTGDSICKINSDTIIFSRQFPEGVNANAYSPVKVSSDDTGEENAIYLNKKDKSIVIFPIIDLDLAEDTLSKPNLEYKIKAFAQHFNGLNEAPASQSISYSVQEKQIILRGKLINSSQPWDRRIETMEINLAPKNVILWK